MREWMLRVERYVKRDPTTDRVTGHVEDPGNLSDLLAQAGAEALFHAEFAIGYEQLWFWRLWAWQVLDAAGLPAEEDRGVRSTVIRTKGSIIGKTEEDVPLTRMERVVKRVPARTAEYFAALIEYHWLFLDSMVAPDEEASIFTFLRLERAGRLGAAEGKPLGDGPALPSPDPPPAFKIRLGLAISSTLRVFEAIAGMLQLVDRERFRPAAVLGAKVAEGQLRGRKTRSDTAAKRGAAWTREVDRRRPGMSEQAAYRRIATSQQKTVAAVKKAVQRHRARATARKSRDSR